MARVEVQARMNRDMICGWLGLADQRWPPDPYVLLGLTPEQCNATLIEQRVHERMCKLRGYQLLHPEEATEGMTRVAQAYIVLSERHGRRSQTLPAATPAPAPAETPVGTLPRAVTDTAVSPRTRVDWQAAPPPVRSGPKTPLPAIPVGIPEPPPRVSTLEEAAPVETEEDVVRRFSEESPEAHDGLVTLQRVIDRADVTRQLLIAWRRAGRYLGNPKRKVTRTLDRTDFGRRLEELLEAVEPYPGFVAQPGRPGYRAVALAHLDISPEVFNAMPDEQREQLARDWALTHKILLAHRRVLLRQFKSLRQRGPFGRAAHALRVSTRKHPVIWTGLVAAVVVTALVLLALRFFG